MLLDRSHEPVALWTLPRVLLEAATWSTGAVRAEMRGCLLDLWGLDLTCPRCAGRGAAIQFGMRGRPPAASNPDEELILGGCVIEPFMHRYTCRYCHTQWGGAPRFADPVLLDLARSGGVLRDEEIGTDGSTPVALRWLNTLFDGVEDLLDQWQPYRLFTEFDSRYGRTVGVDLQCGDDALELEYKPDGSAVSGWDLRIETEGEPPPVSFTLTPGSSSGAQAIKDVGLFTRRAVILGWNPSRWDDWDPPYEEWVTRTGGGEVLAGRWSVANRRNIAPGTEVFLLLQGAQHGLVGHGITTDWPTPDESLDDPAKTTQYVPVEWDRLLPVESRIGRDVLEREVPNVRWRAIRQLRLAGPRRRGGRPAGPVEPAGRLRTSLGLACQRLPAVTGALDQVAPGAHHAQVLHGGQPAERVRLDVIQMQVVRASAAHATLTVPRPDREANMERDVTRDHPGGTGGGRRRVVPGRRTG